MAKMGPTKSRFAAVPAVEPGSYRHNSGKGTNLVGASKTESCSQSQLERLAIADVVMAPLQRAVSAMSARRNAEDDFDLRYDNRGGRQSSVRGSRTGVRASSSHRAERDAQHGTATTLAAQTQQATSIGAQGRQAFRPLSARVGCVLPRPLYASAAHALRACKQSWQTVVSSMGPTPAGQILRASRSRVQHHFSMPLLAASALLGGATVAAGAMAAAPAACCLGAALACAPAATFAAAVAVEIRLRRHAAARASDIAGLHDVENVMREALTRRAEEGFAALQAKFPVAEADRQHFIDDATRYLAAIAADGTSPMAAVAQRALVVMRRPRSYIDQSGPLAIDLPSVLVVDEDYMSNNAIAARHVLSVVWRAVTDTQSSPTRSLQDTENMKASFVYRLADCLESDGHRICYTGILQQLLLVLRGYELPEPTPAPASLFTALLRQEMHNTADEALDATWPANFYARAQKHGYDVYCLDPGRYQEFLTDHLQAYLAEQHDYTPQRKSQSFWH